MSDATPLPLRLLVASRVVAARTGASVRFQALDGRYIDGIARAFDATRVAAQVMVEGEHAGYANYAAYRYEFTAPGLAVAPLPAPRAASPGIAATAWKLARQAWALRRETGWCDLAYVFMPSYIGTLAALWCRLRRRPYAVYLGGDWGGYSPHAFRWRGLRRGLLRPYAWLNGRLEALVVGGAALAIISGDELLRRYARPGRAVVRTEPLAALSAADVSDRPDTCQGTTVRLLFIGALLPGKGLQFLLEALVAIPNATLDVVGTGRDDARRQLDDVAARAGVADRVRWIGYVADPADIRAIYRAADVFVLPTLSEGAPRVVWEAMSQALPVITTDIPPIAAVLTDAVDALLVPPSDAGAIAAAVARLRDDGALRRALIARGRERARERLGRDPSAQAIALLREHVVPRVRAR